MTLDRRTPLRSDPDSTREFIQRARERSQLGISAREAAANLQRNARIGLRVGKRKHRAKIPPRVRARVFARSDGLCICGCGRKCDQIHHALEVDRWRHLELIEQNLVGVYHDCHWSHHFAPNGRIRRDRLPQCVLDLARDEGPKAEAELERYYA